MRAQANSNYNAKKKALYQSVSFRGGRFTEIRSLPLHHDKDGTISYLDPESGLASP